MNTLKPTTPKEVIHEIFLPNNFFPNNQKYPLLIYKQVFIFTNESPAQIQQFLKENSWRNAWVDGIYDFDHYHSNTHEVLIIIEGNCNVQIGGPNYKHYEICQGDVIILPAGVAHKNLGSSQNFKCIGAYPFDVKYDMHYGKADEHPKVDETIKKVKLPKCDPIFGKNGLLFEFWKS
jgi:uncharacterized protein YjlB